MGRLVLSEHVAKTVRKAKMSFAGLPFLPELGILVKVNWFLFNRQAGNFSNRCITISLNGPIHESLEFVSGLIRDSATSADRKYPRDHTSTDPSPGAIAPR
jgi:hypothetical protein